MGNIADEFEGCPTGTCELTHGWDMTCDEADDDAAFERMEELRFEAARGN